MKIQVAIEKIKRFASVSKWIRVSIFLCLSLLLSLVIFQNCGNFKAVDSGSLLLPSSTAVGTVTTDTLSAASFNYPQAVAVNSSGQIFVSDSGGARIRVFSQAGTFLYEFGALGTDNGSFNDPSGLAFDSADNLYVVDSGNNRIQVFKWNGQTTYQYQSQFGTPGSGNAQFASPQGIAIDSVSQVIYVVDSMNNRVQTFDFSGNYLGQFGSLGTAQGQFNLPYGIAIDPNTKNVYVSEISNNRIQSFNSSLQFVSQVGSEGIGNGLFHGPSGMVIDTSSNLYVADAFNNRIQKLNSTGTASLVFGSAGTGPGYFYNPRAVAVDGAGMIYVADTQNNRIQIFNSQGIGILTNNPSCQAQSSIQCITVDPSGLQSGNGLQFCSSDGSGFGYCQVTSCAPGYIINSGTCAKIYAAGCGTAAGDTAVLSIPTTGLCSPGNTASAITSSSNTYSWTCTGNAGAVSNCSVAVAFPGGCGSAASTVPVTSPPNSNLCINNNVASVVAPTSTLFTWTCLGNLGAPTVCSVPLASASACGSANGTTPFTQAPVSGLCATNNVASSVTSNSNGFTWSCLGTTGTSIACSAPLSIVGACGTAAGSVPVTTAPTVNFCGPNNTASAVTTSATSYAWTCSGNYPGSLVNCSVPLSYKGSCGTAAGAPALNPPTLGLCAAQDIAGPVTTNGMNFIWTCAGDTSNLASCSAPMTATSTCGPAAGATPIGSAPTTALCGAGNISSSFIFTGTSYFWFCTGASSSSAISCSVPFAESSLCGASAGLTPLSAAPSTSLCASGGTPSAVLTTSANYAWTCQSANGSATCYAPHSSTSACGPANNGAPVAAPPSGASLCAAGNNSSPVSNSDGVYYWSCSGTDQQTVTCSEPILSPAACGIADSTTVVSVPSSGLCVTGNTSSVVTKTATQYQWTCQGSGGSSVNCSATLAP